MTAPTIIDYLGKVTQVIDPENFFMQIGTDEQLAAFLQFEMTLEDFCEGKNPREYTNPDKLVLGNLALVAEGVNRPWKRGQITRLDLEKRSADIFFIDYGTTVLVNVDQLILEFPDIFSKFAAQALKCCLAGINPIAKSWPSRAIKRFRAMTAQEVFHTVIHCNRNGVFIVSLYTQDIGRAVASQMLDEELGIPSDDVVFEMFADVKDNFKVENQQISEDDWYYDNDDGTDDDINVQETVSSEGINSGYASCDQAGDTTYNNYTEMPGSSNGPSSSDDQYYSQQEQPLPSEISSSEDISVSQLNTECEGSMSNGPLYKSPDKIIPGFDFGQIHKTKNTSKDKLRDKLIKEELTKLQEENIKIKEEMVEQSNMAMLAGYGGLEDRDEDHKKYDDKAGKISKEGANLQKSFDDSRVRHGSGNSKKSRHASGPDHSSDVIKAKSFHDFGRNSPRNSPTSFSNTKKGYRGSRDSPVDRIYDRKASGSPLDFHTDRQHSSSSNSQKVRVDRFDVTKELNKITLVTEMTDNVTHYDIYTSLTKIFKEADKDTEDQTRDKLQRLFSTDMYMYLDKEQLSDVINLVLNRAIRYYGEIHDAMLEIIETLESLEDFIDCLAKGLKKMMDAYIKTHTTRSLFHTQCSKIVAHICNMSMHWGERAHIIQEHVLAVIEKWMLFNSKGTQNGDSVDKLQLIYLDCFEVVWKIASTSLLKSKPDLQTMLSNLCKEKLFQPKISRNVKEKLLQVYVGSFVSMSKEDSEPVDVGCQTDIKMVNVMCQTDISEIKDNFRSNIPDSQTMDFMKSFAENVTVPAWTIPVIGGDNTYDTDSVDMHGWSSPLPCDGSIYKRDCTLQTPDSFSSSYRTSHSNNNSVYLTPNENSWMSDFPPLTASSDNVFQSENDSLPKQDKVTESLPGLAKTHPTWSQCVKAKTSPVENKQKAPTRSVEKQVSPSPVENKQKASTSSVEKQVSPSPVENKQRNPKRTVEKKISPNLVENKQKSPKRSVETQLSPRPAKSYSASRAILHEKSRTDKSKEGKHLSMAGDFQVSKTEESKSKTDILQDIMRETVESSKTFPLVTNDLKSEDISVVSNLNENKVSGAEYSKIPKMDGLYNASTLDSFKGSVDNQNFDNDDAEKYRLHENSTPDHWDDSFSDQDAFSDDKTIGKISKKVETNLKKEQSLSAKETKVDIKEPVDWWSVGDNKTEESEKITETAVSNRKNSEVSEAGVDQNENVIKQDDKNKESSIDYYNLYVDDIDDDDLDDFEWTSDSDDGGYQHHVVKKQNNEHKDNENSALNSNMEHQEEQRQKTFYAEPQRPMWIPGIRKCTICGDTTHLIYNCPDKSRKGFF